MKKKLNIRILFARKRGQQLNKGAVLQISHHYFERDDHSFNNSSLLSRSSLPYGCWDMGVFGGSDIIILASLLSASELVISIFLSNVLVAMTLLLSFIISEHCSSFGLSIHILSNLSAKYTKCPTLRLIRFYHIMVPTSINLMFKGFFTVCWFNTLSPYGMVNRVPSGRRIWFSAGAGVWGNAICICATMGG